jgi:hypothetical protein
MSLYCRAIVLRSGRIGILPEGKYNGVIVTTEAEIGNTLNSEVWSSSGVVGMPPDESVGIRVPIEGGSSDVVIAIKTKITPQDLSKGEAIFFSTDSAGETIKANIKVLGDGTIEFNGAEKRLVTWDELNTALQSMMSLINANFATKLDGGGSPGTATVNITTAKTTTLKTGG